MPIVHVGLPQACSNYGMVQPEIIKSIKKIWFLTQHPAEKWYFRIWSRNQHHYIEMVLQYLISDPVPTYRNDTLEFDLGPSTTV